MACEFGYTLSNSIKHPMETGYIITVSLTSATQQCMCVFNYGTVIGSPYFGTTHVLPQPLNACSVLDWKAVPCRF